MKKHIISIFTKTHKSINREIKLRRSCIVWIYMDVRIMLGAKAELDLNHVHNSRTPLLTDDRKLMENRRGPKAMTTPCRRSPPW